MSSASTLATRPHCASESVWRDVMPRAGWRWHPVCDRACSRLAKESAIRQIQLVKRVSRNQWARWQKEGVTDVRSRNFSQSAKGGRGVPNRSIGNRRCRHSHASVNTFKGKTTYRRNCRCGHNTRSLHVHWHRSAVLFLTPAFKCEVG